MPLTEFVVKTRKNISKYDILIFLLLIFFLISNYYWLRLDNYPLIWDEAHHFAISLRYFEALKNLDFQQIFLADRFYPPFAQLTATLGYAVFGENSDAGILFENAVFVTLLFFSIYGIGKMLKNEIAGFLAAFMVATSPIIFGLSRSILLDFPLITMVTASFWVMLKTERFANTKYSALYGIVFGLGLLTKWSYPVFTVPPLLVYLFPIAKNSFSVLSNSVRNLKFKTRLSKPEFKKYKTMINCLLAIFLCVIIAAPYYFVNYEFIRTGLLTSSSMGTVEGDSPVFSLNSIGYYMATLINLQISFPYFALFIVGSIYFVKNAHLKKEIKILFASWIVPPYIVFTLLGNKDPRYTVPMLSAIALIIAFGLSELFERHKNRLLKISAFLLTVGLGLTILFGTSYNAVNVPSILLTSSYGNIKLFGDYSSLYTRKTMEQDLRSTDIIRTIGEYTQNNRESSIRVLMNNPVVSGPLEYNVVIHRINCSIENVWGNDFSYLTYSDVVVSQEGGFIGMNWQWDQIASVIASFNEYNNKTNSFELLNSFVLPSGWGTVNIYGNKDRHQMVLNETPIINRTNADFGKSIRLMGFNATTFSLNTNPMLKMTYYWQCLQSMHKNYTVYVHFTDEKGSIFFSEEHNPVYALIPTSTWRIGQMYEEGYAITVPQTVPRGTYYIRMGVLDPKTNEHLGIAPTALDDGSCRAIIGTITI